MNNLADRVYRLFSWKNHHYSSTNSSNSNISANNNNNNNQQNNVDEYEIGSSSINNAGACSRQNSTQNQSRCELINLSTSNSSESRRSSSNLSNLSSQNNNPETRNESSLTIQNNDRTENDLIHQPLLSTANTTNNIASFALNNNINSSSSNRRRHHHRSRSHRSSSRRSNQQSNSLQLLLQNSFGSNNNNNNNQTHSNHSSSTNSNNLYDLFNIYKKRERNLLSACCSVFCITILAVSLVETRWFYLNGGGCNVNYLGVGLFFSPGRLEYQIELSKVTKSEIIVYNFVLPNGQVLKNCANREILIIMRTIIAFVFLAIFSSCLGLILDTLGCMQLCFKLTRRHGVFHILTVILCLAINGFCFWLSERMAEQQFETRLKKGKKIDVSFDVSYYLIVLASGMSILATAFTLIRRYSSDEDEQLERLLEEYTGFEDPIHLERSLPAQTNTESLQPCHQNQHDYYFFNNIRQLQHQQPPPPPPSTPPPSLHQTNLISLNMNNNEPPPPYDPTPAIA
jgi:hypothetical protein